MGRMGVFLLFVFATFAVLMLTGRALVARSRRPMPGDSAGESLAIGVAGWMLRLSGWFALLLISAVAVTYISSERTLRARHDAPYPDVAVPSDSASLARGAHLATVLGCPACHGRDLGGNIFFDEPGVARLVAPNLTRGPGGRGAEYTDQELARALRFGVRRTGQVLFVMPTAEFHSLSDADLGAVIAYVRSAPPVPSTMPPTHIKWLGRVGIATGKYLPSREYLHLAAPRPEATPTGVTVEHGRYIAHAICSECHDPEGEVTKAPKGKPPHMNVLSAYDVEGLKRATREGIAMDGRKLDQSMMRPERVGQLTDDELAALQLYFRSRLAASAGKS
ncbi:MAG TPA: c-type cytochrome [Gemmatimonadales bacterium]|nr:c-type cytochrome [Gemmatimonadales bacterium]